MVDRLFFSSIKNEDSRMFYFGNEKGYDKCIIRRKMFEFVYTYIFFNGLRDYYENTQNSKRREFKKFILYVYLHSIRLNMFGNDFKTIDKLFKKKGGQ